MKKLNEFLKSLENRKTQTTKLGIEDYIKQHKHINYCECVIHPDGKIEDARPSHQEKLIEITGIGRDEIWKIIQPTDDALEWLLNKTGCVAVWYNFSKVPSNKPITGEQAYAMRRLLETGTIITKVFY